MNVIEMHILEKRRRAVFMRRLQNGKNLNHLHLPAAEGTTPNYRDEIHTHLKSHLMLISFQIFDIFITVAEWTIS